MEWPSIIITSFILPIIVTIVTSFVFRKLDRKSSLPFLQLKHSYRGLPRGNVDESMRKPFLWGYYKLQRELDDELFEFLKFNNNEVDSWSQHAMESIVNEYEKDSGFDTTAKMIIDKFNTNSKFIDLVGKAKEYLTSSLWHLTLINTGLSSAYDMKISFFSESKSGGLFISQHIHKNEEYKIQLIYFDATLKVEKNARDKKYHSYWSGNSRTVFYLTPEKKYNHIDEKIFRIRYNDLYGKKHCIYCCAKVTSDAVISEMA